MTNAELIECLRCENENYGDCGLYESDCKYRFGLYCAYRQKMHDAADALEEAEKRINELTTKCNQLQAAREQYVKRNRELESQAAFIDAEKLNYQENIEYRDGRIKELETQLPKEGEWMTNIKWYYQQPTQIVATTDGTTFMCRSTGKLCKNATKYGYCKQTVCTIDLARR